jgi:hypothetical protein
MRSFFATFDCHSPAKWLNLLSAEEVVEPLGGGQSEALWRRNIIGEGRLNGFVSFC